MTKLHSDCFPEQRLDRIRFGFANRASSLRLALEDDKRALRPHVEAAQEILLGVEVDVELNKLPEFTLCPQLRDDRLRALQVGHHGAVTWMRIGLPSACAAANAGASNGAPIAGNNEPS